MKALALDENLILRMADGDRDAFTELYVARVPRETRQEISARIKEELVARDAEM